MMRQIRKCSAYYCNTFYISGVVLCLLFAQAIVKAEEMIAVHGRKANVTELVNRKLGGATSWLCFIDKGSRLVWGDLLGKVRIVDTRKLELKAVLKCHKGPVHAGCAVMGSDRLITGGMDNHIRVWDITQRKLLGESYAHDMMGVEGIDILDDGSRFVTIGGDDKIILWTFDPLAKKAEIEQPRALSLEHPALFSKDKLICTDGFMDIYIYDLREKRLLKKIETKCSMISACDATDGVFAVGGGDGCVCLYSSTRYSLMKTLVGHKSDIGAIAICDKERLLATADDGGLILVWDLDAHTLLYRLPQLKTAIAAIAWSPDGNQLAAAEKSGKIHLWSVSIDAEGGQQKASTQEASGKE